MGRSNTSQYLLISLIKSLIAGVSIYFIYTEIAQREDLDEVLDTFNSIANKSTSYVNLLIVFVLMFFNWGLEARKWQILLNRVKKVSFGRAYISTLSGITVSFFTPNRMGEFLGRVLHLKKEFRIKASIASVLGSISQTLVTIFIGAVAAANVVTRHVEWAAQHPLLFWILVIGGLLFFSHLYFNSAFAARLLSKLNVIKRYSEKLEVLTHYNLKEKITILCYSALRYAVFSLQFFVLLLTMQVYVEPHLAFQLIATLFLVLTVIPGTALTELAVRGSVALALFGAFSDNESGILAAAFLIWTINLAIPAILGALSVYLLKLKSDK